MGKPTEKQITDELYEALNWSHAGKTAFSGMTYEQGVEAALDWVLGNADENPIEQKYED